jgi:hypothetical protein
MPDTPYRYRPHLSAYIREWKAKQPKAPRVPKTVEETRAKKTAYMQKYRASNRGKINEAQRAGYAARGKHTYAHKTRNKLTKHNHVRNLELLAARPKPDCCDVCGGNRGMIVFDHCHRTNHFRGWLCNGCNRALGFVDDDPQRLRMLAAYLDRTKNGQGAQFNIPGL